VNQSDSELPLKDYPDWNGNMIRNLKRSIRSYRTTLFSGVMLGLLSVHTLEDILLMSIGRFLPLPLLVMYAIGLCMSWLVMGVIVNRLMGNRLGSGGHEHG
jgi:Na+/glutamate symporter